MQEDSMMNTSKGRMDGVPPVPKVRFPPLRPVPLLLSITLLLAATSAIPGEKPRFRRVSMEKIKPGETSAWIENAVRDRGLQKELLEMLGQSTDPVSSAYKRVARAYFDEADLNRRLVRLETERREERRPAAAVLLDYHIALTKAARGDAVGASAFMGICQVPDEKTACEAAGIARDVEAVAAKTVLDENQIRYVLRRSRVLLLSEAAPPPFSGPLIRLIPDQLYALGLPLEAAILADRAVKGDKSEQSRRLRSRIPIFLAGAGDFAGAAQYPIEDDKHGALGALRYEWSIQGGRFREALKLQQRLGPDQVASLLSDGKDPYTSLIPDGQDLKLRGAFLLYLAGEQKAALKELEVISETAKLPTVRHMARLRMAQILLSENPELAHKIAEDVAYQAQEKDLTAVEYVATVLNAWAHYYRKDYFAAVVDFTKAGGIPVQGTGYNAVEYSRILGMFVASAKMAPGGNHTPLIHRLNGMLQAKPYRHELYLLSAFLPPGAGEDFFVREAVANLEFRGDRWTALNIWIDRKKRAERFLAANTNPGALRGFSTSVLWSKTMETFPAARKLLAKPLHPESHRIGLYPSFSGIGPANFRPGEGNLFVFENAGEAHFYLVAGVDRPYWAGAGRYRRLVPNKVMDIFHLTLDAQRAKALKTGCAFGQTENCRRFQKDLEPLRERLKSSEMVTLNVLLNPEFDPDYDAVLSPQSIVVNYFRYAESRPNLRPLAELKIYRASACSESPAGLESETVDGFVKSWLDTDLKGIWMFPAKYDDGSRNGKKRPVYLRSGICGEERLRLWDLDRFAASGGPGIVLFPGTRDSAYDAALIQHFADRGTITIEAPADFTAALIKSVKENGGKDHPRSLRAIVQKERRKYKESFPVRIVYPGLVP